MPDVESWEALAHTVWDWGSKMGLGGLVVALVGWFLRRRLDERDKAVERGRASLRDARPEVVPIGGAFMGDHRGTFRLHNRGPGAARGIRVTFPGAKAEGHINDIDAGHRRDTPEVDFSDSTFFRTALPAPAELTVRYQDRYGNEYSVTLPVRQEQRADGRFHMLPEWGNYRVIEPKLTDKRLREMGGP
jgi:hypothetical protein